MRFDQRKERHTAKYRRMRYNFLRANPLCARCEARGIIRGATELDHIVPIRDAPKRMFDVTNLQGLCRPCHEDKTADENRTPDANDGRWLSRAQVSAFRQRLKEIEDEARQAQSGGA